MRIKKIMAYLIVVLLVVKSPIIAYAESTPGTVTVEGGSIGSGGIEGNSGVLKGTALAVVMATLASVGIQVKLAVEDYEHGTSALNFLEDKFAEWDSKAQAGWDAYNALNSTKVGANGELYVNAEGQSVIQKFLNWLDSEHYIATESGSENAGVDGTFFGNTWNGPSGYSYVVSDGLSANIACTRYENDPREIIFAFASQPFSFSKINQLGGKTISSGTTSYNGWYFCYSTNFFIESDVTDLFDISTLGYYATKYNNPVIQYLESLSGEVPDTNIGQTGFYGETADIPQLVDESGNGKILTVQPGLIGQVQDAYTGSNNATINIQDYLDALTDLYGLQALPQDITDVPDITIPGEDAITGTKEDVAVIDRDLVLAPDITVPADPGAITWPEVPEIAVPVADPSVPSDPDISIPAMSIDLTQYFPFCLPFDIYHILQKLNAEPVTPEITVDWGNILGSFGIDYVMNLDLHDYDNLAELLRNMETAAFVVGLAVITRQMFLRG